MRWFSNLPIKGKLVVIMVIATVVALAVAGGALLSYQWNELRTMVCRKKPFLKLDILDQIGRAHV